MSTSFWDRHPNLSAALLLLAATLFGLLAAGPGTPPNTAAPVDTIDHHWEAYGPHGMEP
jgi:hypothetical protein